MTRRRQDISTLEPTRYEVVLYVDQRRVRTLGFSTRATRQVLMDFAGANGEELLSYMNEAEQEAEWTYDRGTGLVFGFGKVAVAFSGKTERDCAL